MNISEYPGTLLARSFTRPVFLALARGRKSADVFRFLNAFRPLGRRVSVRDFFEAAFEALSRSYRSEYVYKSAIANKIVFGRHSPRTSSLAVELPVGRSIVDLAVFNGVSTAYEIKTEFDTPRRLVTQTTDYLKVFDEVYIVTHPALARLYAGVANAAVGIIALDARDRLKVIRKAVTASQTHDARLRFRMLRRSEYLPRLEAATGKQFDLPNGLIANYCEMLFSGLEKEHGDAIFLDAMRTRTTGLGVSTFLRSLPEHLRVLGYSVHLSHAQRARILERVCT